MSEQELEESERWAAVDALIERVAAQGARPGSLDTQAREEAELVRSLTASRVGEESVAHPDEGVVHVEVGGARWGHAGEAEVRAVCAHCRVIRALGSEPASPLREAGGQEIDRVAAVAVAALEPLMPRSPALAAHLSPYQAGAAAAAQGRSRSSQPHSGGEAQEAWLRGWDESMGAAEPSM